MSADLPLVRKGSMHGRRFDPWNLAVRVSPSSKAVVDVTSQMSGVRSVIFHGSRVIGLDHRYSDIDLTVIVADAEAALDVRRKVQAVAKYEPAFVDYFEDAPVEFWSDGQLEIGLHIYTVSEVQDRIVAATAGPVGLERHGAWIQHVLMESQILFDPGGLARTMRVQGAMPDAKHFTELADTYLSRLSQKLTWWNVRPQWKTSNEQLGDTAVLLDEVARAHYAVNSAFYMPGGKNYQADLAWLQPNLTQTINDLLSFDPNTPNSGHIRDATAEAFHDLSDARWQMTSPSWTNAPAEVIGHAQLLAKQSMIETTKVCLEARMQLSRGDRAELEGRRDRSIRCWSSALHEAHGKDETAFASAAQRLGFPLHSAVRHQVSPAARDDGSRLIR